MKYSEKPKEELDLARAFFDQMLNANDVNDLDKLWRKFLHHLDRTWNKAEGHFHKSPKWHSWAGKYVTLRRTDDLLSYLIHARNTDEHSVEDISKGEPGSIKINPASGLNSIESLELNFGENGELLQLETTSPIEVIFTPSQIHLLPVENRNRVYPAPTLHLGKGLPSTSVIEVASAGLKFYEDFLLAANRYFVK